MHPLPVRPGIHRAPDGRIVVQSRLGAGFGQRPEQRGQFGARLTGQPELPAPAAVCGLPQMEVPPGRVQLLLGSAAVGVDVVDHLIGQGAQILRSERFREPGQQPLPLGQVGRVEPAMIHPVQGPLDDRHLLRGHLPGPLRRRQLRPHRGQRLAGHAVSVPDRRPGPHPPGRLPRGESQRAINVRTRFPWANTSGRFRRSASAISRMIGHRQPVPDPFEVLHERDELAVSKSSRPPSSTILTRWSTPRLTCSRARSTGDTSPTVPSPKLMGSSLLEDPFDCKHLTRPRQGCTEKLLRDRIGHFDSLRART